MHYFHKDTIYSVTSKKQAQDIVVTVVYDNLMFARVKSQKK